jgi:hypothetical protein
VTRRCGHCRRRAALRIRNAYTRSANGRYVCRSAVCWGFITGGYPAEGVAL